MPQYIENKTQTSLICENPSYRKHIIETAIEANPSPLFKDFVQKYYAYLPVDYMQPNKAQFFATIAQKSFDFCMQLPGGKTKIEFFHNLKSEYHGTVLQIVTPDKPFIIDSIISLLSRYNVSIELFFHPVIDLQRNTKGYLEFIGQNSNYSESIVFAVLKGVTAGNEQELSNALERILSKIDVVVDVQQSIVAQISTIIDNNSICSAEDVKFLRWIQDNNFTFLGSLQYTKQIGVQDICGDISVYNHDRNYIEDIFDKILAAEVSGCLFLGKLNQISEVSTGKFVDYITVRTNNKIMLYFGFYCSGLNAQSIKNIPILSTKLEYVLSRSSFKYNGHNYKKFVSIIENLPREALLQIADEDLYCMCLHILSAMMTNTLKLFAQVDSSRESLNILVFMPIERLTPETHLAITKYLSSKFNTKVITDEITAMSSSFCYLSVALETKGLIPEFSITDIEQELDHISARWYISLNRELESKNFDVGMIVESAFPKEYQYLFSPSEGAEDYVFLHQIGKKHHILFNLQKVKTRDYKIKIYSSSKVVLSDILPLIENLGFKAITQQMFRITIGSKDRWLCEFTLCTSCQSNDPFEVLKNNIEYSLQLMVTGKLEVDAMCKLIVLAGFDWRRVSALKAVVAYVNQIGISYGKEYVQSVLVKHHIFSGLLIKFFETKFNPQHPSRDKVKDIDEELIRFLNEVTNSVEDKILRMIYGVIIAMTRTNYYQFYNGVTKSYISFKLDSKKVPNLPMPVPYAEIFVYSHDFDGVHLRGGNVARGGLRWSDRKEDYRTEALGLMKAQMTKNSVIVPVGSKGAFYIKIPSEGIEQSLYMEKVIECYKKFLRGLLDVTDNVVDGNTIHPSNTVIYDNNDPYLVVAADKGTASFSDYANSVSAEYNYWLGDAFASGGSVGYDHKKIGITAKGAWVSVRRHFEEMGIDVQKDNITVVGIGDMSGDVFGNGLLLSKAMKLVAAFNHKHIFIDPTPDPLISFNERKRLFILPRSQWSDYNSNLISKGGDVYERSAKTIAISNQAMQLLDIEDPIITPDELINKILLANVDLIWNGGIGTYIKASDESHLDVGDKANDSLRCNGRDIRAKVIAEGGNLGCSQRGRVEYAQAGGKINTDFIDNSAGVDCSDHEVNIKIAFESAIKNANLSVEKRNKLLEIMTDAVANLVLSDNENQTQALTIVERSNAYNTGMFARLIEYLETHGSLNRKVEFLPNDVDLNKRSINKESFTRPELAILMSYSKMSLYHDLLHSKIAEDSYVERFLLGYFPALMQENFLQHILQHQLRKEIILTVITNKIVNQLGGPIINQIRSETDASLCDIVRAYMVVNHIFGIDNLWIETTKLTNTVTLNVQIDIFSELIKLMRRGISWFVRNLEQPIDIAEAIEIYGGSVEKMCSNMRSFLLGHAQTKFHDKVAWYKESNVPDGFSSKVAILESGVSALDIMTLALSVGRAVDHVTELYFKIADRFSIDWLRRSAEKYIADSYWNRMSIQALKDDLYDKQRRILHSIITSYDNSNAQLNFDEWMKCHEKHVSRFMNFIVELKLQENMELNMVILANKQFEILLRKI